MACCLYAGLSACSSGGDDDADAQSAVCYQTTLQNCGPGPWDPFGIALSLAWYSGQCTEEVACTDTPIRTDLNAGIVTEDFISENWTTNQGVDREPNDDPAQAAPYVVGTGSGLLITGTVNDTTDTADFFALAFEPADYIAYLCRTVDDCQQPWLQTDELHLELYDQNETLIQTTEMMQIASGHAIVFSPSQDLQYFLAVRAADTQNADYDYKLVVTD